MPHEFDEDVEYDCDIDIYGDLDLDVISDSIQDGADIEKLIISIRKSRTEIEFLKKLKKRRSEPIDIKISKLENNENNLRSFILELMPKYFPKQNSVDFPGVGKISKRKTKGKWVVTDEEVFSELLKKYDLYDEVVNTKTTINKKKVPNAVSRMWALSEEELCGVKFEEPENDSSLILKIYEAIEGEEEQESELGF